MHRTLPAYPLVFPALIAALLCFGSCATSLVRPYLGVAEPVHDARQLVVVVTADWDSSAGHLQSYERDAASDSWRPVREPVALILGGRGLGWGNGLHGQALTDAPVKHEGDHRSPAGAFLLSAVYGYNAETAVPNLKMPYIALDSTVQCVDDPS